MATEREARAYDTGAEDGVDAANADAPSPENDAGDVIGRAWSAAEDQGELRTQREREEYFVGWTHGYVNRAEGIEDEERRRDEESTRALPGAGEGTDATVRHSAASAGEGEQDADAASPPANQAQRTRHSDGHR